MKRLGILALIFLSLAFGSKTYAQSQYSDTLTRMEKSLFGVDYSSQNDDARIKRIEETVYGSASSSPLPQRFNKLSKDLSADLIGQEIKPKKDTFEEEQDSYKEDVPKEDSTVNYPVVDGLEQKVFNKVYKNIDVNQRLANLEKKVFNKAYSDDLNARTERLKAAVMPEKLAQSSDDSDDDDSYYTFKDNSMNQKQSEDIEQSTGNAVNIPSYNRNSSVLDEYQGDSDMAIPLASLEKQVLKRNYPNDTISNRLLRMELKVFNASFTNDDEQTRLERISSAYQAKKSSSRYDGNKFAQHAATAMQIGAIVLMILAAIL
jgi:hypothetical protein